MATGLEERALVSDRLLDWRLGHNMVLPGHWPYLATLWIMLLAMVNGILTSIVLETIVLSRQMVFKTAFRTAIGMSLISMLAMEIAMNLVDVVLTGGAVLTLSVVPVMFAAGFVAAVPYNYWQLKALGKACH